MRFKCPTGQHQFKKNSDFQGAFIPAKRTQIQPDSQVSCNTNDFFENPN